MSLVIPDEIVQASGLSERDLFQALVLMLYQREKISLGRASRILSLTNLEFQSLLAEQNLYIRYGVEDLHEDVENLKELGLL